MPRYETDPRLKLSEEEWESLSPAERTARIFGSRSQQIIASKGSSKMPDMRVPLGLDSSDLTSYPPEYLRKLLNQEQNE